MTTTKERFIVKKRIKFGMLFGFYIYDTIERKDIGFEFDEEEEYLAKSKCELKNALCN